MSFCLSLSINLFFRFRLVRSSLLNLPHERIHVQRQLSTPSAQFAVFSTVRTTTDSDSFSRRNVVRSSCFSWQVRCHRILEKVEYHLLSREFALGQALRMYLEHMRENLFIGSQTAGNFCDVEMHKYVYVYIYIYMHTHTYKNMYLYIPLFLIAHYD